MHNGKATYEGRPESKGIFVRVTKKDGEVVEGLIQNNLLLLKPWQDVTVVLNRPKEGKHFRPVETFKRHELDRVEVLGLVGCQA